MIEGKGKAHPSKTMKARGGVEIQLYSLFNVGARWGWVVKATAWPLYPREETRYPLNRGNCIIKNSYLSFVTFRSINYKRILVSVKQVLFLADCLLIYVFERAEPHQVKLEVMSVLPSTKVVQELQSVHFISGILLVVFRLKFLEL